MNDVFSRFFPDLIARATGPFTFRLVVQPTVAAILAIRDGVKDANAGRPAYLWQVYKDPRLRKGLLREGWRTISRVFGLAVLIDIVFQIIVFRWVHPLQAIVVATVLALVPYILLRGPTNRAARLIRRRRASRQSH